MMFQKKTKIVSTLGPASDDEKIMLKMIRAGVNVFRINCSHSSHEQMENFVEKIRKINRENNLNISILSDLQGPKLRIGTVKEGTFIKKKDVLLFTNQECIGDSEKVFMTYKNFAKDVKVGERILLDDGKLIFNVVSTDGLGEVKAEVLQGGELKSNKGVNLPNTKVSLPALTPKDIEDVILSVKLGVDWLALSFVRDEKDVLELSELIKKHNSSIPIISKIEKPEAIEKIDSILEVTDAIMVARGDLGIEIPAESVPLIQKKIVLKAKKKAKPVIVATQMLESMIDNLIPTRAEINDVANSVLDGCDAVMLSAETSVGKHPVEVVEQMKKVLQSVEEDESIRNFTQEPKDKSSEGYVTDYICYNASSMAKGIKAEAVIAFTYSGYTPYKVSSYRPNAHIIAFTSNRNLLTRLNLLWGVRAFFYDKDVSTDQAVEEVNQFCLKNKIVRKNALVVNMSSMPLHKKGRVNTIRITRLICNCTKGKE
ncbi:pyruvate kinase [Ichthyobacterium seriolicida]|uniref:Pyruvate kinase n=1 Tax=Ichthyobacterium seriolicida TaxID=242600 RepID=A0A1J1DXE5_9FLAO|nr:pyruvate kinase [Ichthyobacterium seriolicida]BAV94527.1 pyruvate kinase [Ichthyobacterium seriolicida]